MTLSRRREMARMVVERRSVSIRLTWHPFKPSSACYRYRPKRSDENAEIADWLVGLTQVNGSWGFGLWFLYVRNVNCIGWNHERIGRIYWELELNPRIKPKKRIVRERPEPLVVPVCANENWSMDCMHDQLGDGRSVRLLNVIDH